MIWIYRHNFTKKPCLTHLFKKSKIMLSNMPEQASKPGNTKNCKTEKNKFIHYAQIRNLKCVLLHQAFCHTIVRKEKFGVTAKVASALTSLPKSAPFEKNNVVPPKRLRCTSSPPPADGYSCG